MGKFLLAAILQWTFKTDIPGRLPAGWQTRGDSLAPVYQIRADADGNRFLAAESLKSDVQLGVAAGLKRPDIGSLSWRWRIWELPVNASERSVKTMDSAASVYAVFGSRLFPRIIKYVWSTAEPAGTAFKHPNSGRVAILVVASGNAATGRWQSVTRNLVEDYKAAFGSEPDNLTAVGVKTDSDSTGTSARADYDDIRLEK
jgi:hypothetical protein